MEQTRIKVPEGYYEVRERIRTLLAGEKLQVIIAIDGRCGSGKTTLAAWLIEQFDGNLFHMDDFYLRSGQRTPERLAETGGNVDYERFRKEVAVPLAAGREVLYRRFDCVSFSLEEPVLFPPKRLNVVEGSYSMHPELRDFYDMTVFPEISIISNRRCIIADAISKVFNRR